MLKVVHRNITRHIRAIKPPSLPTFHTLLLCACFASALVASKSPSKPVVAYTLLFNSVISNPAQTSSKGESFHACLCLTAVYIHYMRALDSVKKYNSEL